MQIIDYEAIRQNALYFKKILKSSKLCAVIKNDAYGHGLIDVAKCLVDIVDFYAVGCVAEASKIAFLKKDILILLPLNAEDCAVAIQNNFILTIDSFLTLDIVSRVAKQLGKKVRAHIKIDSGMSRLGFSLAQINLICQMLKTLPQINVCGVFSHFWGENAADCDKPFEIFSQAANTLENNLHRVLVKHIANTSAALLSSKYHIDMARVGIGLFGYGTSQLLPAKTVMGKVIAVQNVKSGDVVGYGGKYICKCDTQIAVIDYGYAMGLGRVLRGKKVSVNGNLYPIVAICMAMSMIDIGEDNVVVGDNVTLLGDGVNISSDDVIIYELLCGLR